MSEEIHPIARALLSGQSDEPDRQISCCICGRPTDCPGFIVAAVKTWNAHKRDQEPPIRPSEMGIACPGECTAVLFAQKHADVQEEQATTRAYLAMLFRGVYNPESLYWLRSHGCKKQVERVLHEEGTKAHG